MIKSDLQLKNRGQKVFFKSFQKITLPVHLAGKALNVLSKKITKKA